jgi:hypothetical protein
VVIALTELLKSPSKRAAIHQVQLLEEAIKDPWDADVSTPTALMIAKEGLTTFYRSTSTAILFPSQNLVEWTLETGKASHR